jgi:TolA-binding protein
MMLSILLALTATLSPEQSRVLVERYNSAQEAIGRNDYTAAAGKLSTLVRDFGNSEFGDEMRFALAETYFNLGQYGRSGDIFTELIEKPRYGYIRPEAMYGLALSATMQGNYAKARGTLESLAKEQGYDKDPRVAFAAGVLHYFQGEYQQAIVRLDGLTIPEARFYLAKAYAQVGKPLQALIKFKEITDEVPNTPLATLAHFAAGQALFQNRDFDGARAKFAVFIEQFPSSALADYAAYFLGCALLAQRQYAAGITQLTPLTRHPNNLIAAHANYFIGYADLALNKPQEAVERFQRVRANYPNTKVASYANLQLSQAMLATADTAQTLLATSQLATMFKSGELSGVGNYLSGVIFYQVGDYARAADQFEDVLVNYASTSLREPACAMLLLSRNSLGDFEQTVAIGAKYVRDYPDDKTGWRARTLYFLAEGFYYDKKYNEADAFYQQAATAGGNASDIAPYARLGRCYSLYHLGRLAEAAAGFKGLTLARTQDTLFTISAYLGYGYALFNQKEYLKALDVFEALANTFPNFKMAAIPGYFWSGYCYYQLQYYGQAVDAWTQLINKFPEDDPKAAEAAFRSGDTYFKALEYDKAVASFNFVIERYPQSDFAAPSQALVAQSFYNRRQFTDAIREYQKFLDLYPSDPQVPGVRKSLEMSYYFAGQEDSLVMEDFLRRFPQSELAAEGQFRKGRALFDAERFNEAIVELQKAVVNFPTATVAAEAQLLTAEAYSSLEQWTDAAAAYEKFLSYYPDHPQRAGATFNMATALFNAADYARSLEIFQTVIDSFPESEYVESAKQNIDICRRRLGAGLVGETEGEPAPGTPPEGSAAPPTEGDKQQ